MLKRRNWAFVDHKVVLWWRVPTETMLVYAKNCADWSSCFKWTRTIKCSEFVFPGHPVYMYSTIKHNCLIAVTSAWCTVLHQSSDSIPRSVGRSPLFFGAHAHKSDLNHLRTKRLIVQKFFTETRRNINNSREGGLEPNRKWGRSVCTISCIYGRSSSVMFCGVWGSPGTLESDFDGPAQLFLWFYIHTEP